MPDNAAEPPHDRAAPVCPNCLAGMQTGADFCCQCGSPVSGTSVLDPIKHIHAAGWLYRKASSGRPRLFVVIGMWLIFGPAALLLPIGVGFQLFSAAHWHTHAYGYTLEDGLGLVVGGSLGLLHAAILLKVTLAYLHGPEKFDLSTGRRVAMAYLTQAMKTDWSVALWTALSFALAIVLAAASGPELGFVDHLWADAGRLFAFSLSATLIITSISRPRRRNAMTVLGLLCLGANVLLVIVLSYRLFLC